MEQCQCLYLRLWPLYTNVTAVALDDAELLLLANNSEVVLASLAAVRDGEALARHAESPAVRRAVGLVARAQLVVVDAAAVAAEDNRLGARLVVANVHGLAAWKSLIDALVVLAVSVGEEADCNIAVERVGDRDSHGGDKKGVEGKHLDLSNWLVFILKVIRGS